MSASTHDLLAEIAAACAVNGTHYDLSVTGRVQLGERWDPPIDGAYVTVSGGDVSTTAAVDVYHWSYRLTVLIQGWAPSPADPGGRLQAGMELRADLLAALHGALVTARGTHAIALRARDVQVSAAVLDSELLDGAHMAGWGYVAIEASMTVDGNPGRL